MGNTSAKKRIVGNRKKSSIVKFTKQHKIGEGKYGRVFRGIRDHDSFEVAMKYLDFSKLPEDKLTTQVERTLSELDAMKRLGKNDNVVELFDIRLEGTSIVIIMEFCSKGNFRTVLQREAPLTSINAVHKYIYDIVSGLRALRVASIVHRDLKPENILVGGDGKLKLCDFGMARQLDGYDANRICGTLLYIAPEVMKREKYSHKIDLWALGVILYEMLVDDHPFLSADVGIDSFASPKEIARINMILIKSKRNENKETEISFPMLPEELINARNLTCKLLQENPQNRLSYNKLFAALRIKQIDSTETEQALTINRNSSFLGKDSSGKSHTVFQRSSTIDSGSKNARVVDERKFQNWGPQCVYLQSIKLTEIDQGRPRLITLNADITAQDAIGILHENHISSAPVIDADGNTNGFVDNADLVKHLLDTMQSKKSNFLRGLIVPSTKVVNYGKAKEFQNAPFSVLEDSNLLSTAIHMGSGVKRLGVSNRDGEFVKVISQSAVNEFLVERVKKLKSQFREMQRKTKDITKKDDIGKIKELTLVKLGHALVKIVDKSVDKLNLVPNDRNMIVARSSINAAHAFLLLSNNNITAIPIVDSKGRMVNVLSTSDIALLTFVDFYDEKSEEKSNQLNFNRRASEAAVKIKLAFDALNTMGTLNSFMMDLRSL